MIQRRRLSKLIPNLRRLRTQSAAGARMVCDMTDKEFEFLLQLYALRRSGL